MKRILIIVVLLFCYSQNHIATADVGVLNLRNYYGVNSGLKMLFYGGLKMSFFSGLRLSYI
ncbi:enterotoxin SEM [Staphylococcus aureus]|nr:enterotoxin SEM [Staphylococcus aureus]